MKQKQRDIAPPGTPSAIAEWAGLIVILIATIIAYSPAITGGFLWDDPDYIKNNLLLRDASGLWKIWTAPTASPQWYPMTFTTLWVEYQLWGENTAGYHLTNLFLHCSTVLLLWRLLKMLRIRGALLAAGIFALHPMMCESVAWMTERKNTLSLMLALGSLYYSLSSGRTPVSRLGVRVLNSRESTPTPNAPSPLPSPRGRGSKTILSLVLFTLALLSKSVVATLPAVYLVIIWWRDGVITRKDFLRMIPFFILGAGMASVTAYLESHHVGASATLVPELDLSFAQRILIAGRVIWFYASKLVMPWDFSFIYPRWQIDPAETLQWFFPAAVLFVLVTLATWQNKIGRGPFAAFSIFCGVLLPVLGFFNVYPMRFSFVADHFAYHASIAIIVLIAAGLTRVMKHASWIVLIPLLAITFNRAGVYTDARTLWTDTYNRNPNSAMVNVNLGNAIRFDPNYSPLELPYVDALYRRALELDPKNAEMHLLVGITTGAKGDIAGAEAAFREAVKLNPIHAESWYYLGESLRHQKRWDEAIAAYDRSLELQPDAKKTIDNRNEAIKGKGG